uniref:Uncharacterized protein n=1 Tax=Candidatus Kentrum sp. LFY TaxID=2126342 RepID=A0A450WRW6_9GAMM|nr:MAG: hypothetical protein BECKLFY1418C_GA0070996_10634 [Candidatus Kentron sp. LFY]
MQNVILRFPVALGPFSTSFSLRSALISLSESILLSPFDSGTDLDETNRISRYDFLPIALFRDGILSFGASKRQNSPNTRSEGVPCSKVRVPCGSRGVRWFRILFTVPSRDTIEHFRGASGMNTELLARLDHPMEVSSIYEI